MANIREELPTPQNISPDFSNKSELNPVETKQEQEKAAWTQLLGEGLSIEVPPPPASLTPELIDKLKTLGFRLLYIPNLDLGSLGELQDQGFNKYLQGLEARYPNWRNFITMSSEEKENTSIARNLLPEYWMSVADGFISFPTLPGEWVLVETVRPSLAEEQDQASPAMQAMQLERRTGVSANEVNNIFETLLTPWLNEQTGMNFSGNDCRLPSAIELNLLLNRENISKGAGTALDETALEWTNDTTTLGGVPRQIFIGGELESGAASFYSGLPERAISDVGFRALVSVGR